MMVRALRAHWPEYLMEAAELGLFMVSAAVIGTLFEYPGSPVHMAIGDPAVRRLLTGLAMGATAIAIIYSPWGRQSGAHFNPAVTLAFYRLGKIEKRDAIFYVAAQFIGGVAAVTLISFVLGSAFTNPPVHHVVTVPGSRGVPLAFGAELFMSVVLMLTVLTFSNRATLARYTGVAAGFLVATYIAIESPVSGMSINPARTLASAVPAGLWTALWIYFVAPPVGMLLATELYVRMAGRADVRCAKLHHTHDKRCIFRCGYAAETAAPAPMEPMAPGALIQEA